MSGKNMVWLALLVGCVAGMLMSIAKFPQEQWNDIGALIITTIGVCSLLAVAPGSVDK